MSTKVGVHGINDLIAVEKNSAYDYGMDTIAEVLQRYLLAHSDNLRDALSPLAEPTTSRFARAGVASSARGMKGDEFARGVAQKTKGGADVGFPMEKLIYRLGWTLDYAKAATPADMARKTISVTIGNRQDILVELRKALFLPTNYTFTDELVDPNQDTQDLPVKRLINADSFPIPASPFGVEFDTSSHTHYTGIDWDAANAAAKAAAIDALLDNVGEHYTDADIKLVLASTNVSDISVLSEFTPPTANYVQPVGATDQTQTRATPSRTDNRLVGYWRGNYEIWSKPWGLANYPLAINYNAPEKALKYRERGNAALRGLRLKSTFENAPLITEFMEHEFGFGVWGRTAAAVLFMNDGAATYTAPSIS